MRNTILRDMDTLHHDPVNGFYDKSLDMFFPDLGEWLKFKYEKKWSDIL